MKTYIAHSFTTTSGVERISHLTNGGQFGPVNPVEISPIEGKRIGQLPGARVRSGFRRSASAFTLVEALMAVGVLAIITAACLSSLLVDQIAVRKAKEEAIAMDFLTKYVENIKALPFTSVSGGTPINYLYNGSGGGPLIAIPANTTWVSLNTTAYQTFYPDLLWLNNRNPQMQVTLAKNNLAGVLHDIEINVKVDWDSPLSAGARQEVQVDFCRTADVPLL